MRAFQFFNLNKEEDRQELLTLASNFLGKLIGGDTRGMDMGMAMGMANIGDILENIIIFLEDLLGFFNILGLTRSDVDTRGKKPMGMGMGMGMGNGNLFGNIFGLLNIIFGRRALMPDEYNFDQSYPQMMNRKIEIETILEFLPESILQTIADVVETPCRFANLIAADNELLGDACEFFQNLDE